MLKTTSQRVFRKTHREQGRSMVEMLGVLAIVGVLSVGAISGYRYAMNKYRANQTVNELNLLAHQVAIAMMSRSGVSGTLKLGEPYDTNKKLTSAGYDIAFGCGESGDEKPCQNQNKFHFEVKQVSEGVCKELVQMSEHIQFIAARPETCATGTADLNFVFELPEVIGPDPVEMSSDSSEEDGDPRCELGQVWYDTGNNTGKCCPSEAPYWNGSACATCPNDFPKFSAGTCLPENGCRENADCGEDQYCALSGMGYNCEQEFGYNLNDSDHHGECRSVTGDLKTITLTLGGNTKIIKVSTEYTTWWSTKRFCEKLGGHYHLVSLRDLNCTSSGCDDKATLRTVFYDNNGIWGTWTIDEGSEVCETYYIDFNDNSSVNLGDRYHSNNAVCVE